MRGSIISHLAMTTFCWLPPDSAPTGMSMPAVRIASSRIISSIGRALGGAVDDAGLATSRSSAAKERLSRTDIGSISPSVLRSSGISAMPMLSALAPPRGLAMRDGLAVDQDLAGDAAQHAEERQQQFALALAVEAAEADDLAGAGRSARCPSAGRSRRGCGPRAPAACRSGTGAGLGGKTWLYSRPIISSTTSLSVLVPAL